MNNDFLLDWFRIGLMAYCSILYLPQMLISYVFWTENVGCGSIKFWWIIYEIVLNRLLCFISLAGTIGLCNTVYEADKNYMMRPDVNRKKIGENSGVLYTLVYPVNVTFNETTGSLSKEFLYSFHPIELWRYQDRSLYIMYKPF